MAEENKRPGWYPDPVGGGGERWWNGAGWSDSRRGGPVVPPPPPSVTLRAASPPVYSAANPAPQRPDPYAPPLTQVPTGRTLSLNSSVNRNAMIGFITGIISAFFGLLPIIAPVAIVFSILGIINARALRAQGVTQNLMVFAVIGLISGIVGAITGLASLAAFVVPFFSVSFE